jgi:hypothetical protein
MIWDLIVSKNLQVRMRRCTMEESLVRERYVMKRVPNQSRSNDRETEGHFAASLS